MENNYMPSDSEISEASKVLHIWGGLRDRNLDDQAIVRRMLIAASDARIVDIKKENL